MRTQAAHPPLWRGPDEARELDVLGIGQCSLDHVCVVDAWPRFAGKAPLRSYQRLAGGQVATAVLACAQLGLRAAFVGAVGEDEAAEAVLSPLRSAGIDVSAVRREKATDTQLAVILVERASGERSVLWYRDPRLRLRPEDLPPGLIERARILHLDAGDPELAIPAARAARRAHVAVTLDADSLGPGVAELLREIDFPIVSREFAETFSETGSVRDGLDRLVALGARLAVATLGAGGALARDGRREIRSPAFRVPARDTTGAGDAFHGAFAWALLRGFEAERVLRVANAAAALACRAAGAQGSLPSRGELEAFLEAEQPGPWSDPEAGA